MIEKFCCDCLQKKCRDIKAVKPLYSCLSPESVEYYEMNAAGLLTYSLFTAFPSRAAGTVT